MLFQNKYRIESTRLSNWDYGSPASYFITICTQDHENYFGCIENHKMILSQIGKIVKSEWYKTLIIRADMNIKLGEFIIMPNHIHGIITIGKNKYNSENLNNIQRGRDAMLGVSIIPNQGRDAMLGVSIMPNQSRDAMHGVSTAKTKSGPQSNNLPSIMRGFKSSVTINARKIDPIFAWQTRYYEHIIQNKKSYNSISNYIITNPLNWKNDSRRKSLIKRALFSLKNHNL